MLAQTTDSASSNNTMASRIFNILAEKKGTNTFDWRPESMHIHCFCHKIALIVNAGLAELGIVAPPPAKIKESILGTFPYADNMETILEEDDQQSPATGPFHKTDSNSDNKSKPEHDEEELATLLKAQENNVSKSESEEGEYQATNRNESNTLDRLTKKVCGKIITFFISKMHTKDEN